MSFVGLNEAIIIGAAAVALLLGPKKLPELARSLDESKKGFKVSMKEAEEIGEEMEELADDVTEPVTESAS